MAVVASRRTVLLGGLALATAARAAETLRIAAASDLQVVLPLIAAGFERTTGIATRLTFGASGNLARQIRQGAPFDVFLSADQQFVSDLARDGVVPLAGPVYARGRLAVIAPAGSAFARLMREPPDPMVQLAAVADRGMAFRIAIANPEHAPYGQRAIEALTSRGVLEKLRSRLVYGETVAQAAQFVVTQAAAVGIVGSSLTFAPALRGQLVSVPIPADWHTPLDQSLAVTVKAGAATQILVDYILGDTARAIFTTHGFEMPQR